jgi:hypothetical protein
VILNFHLLLNLYIYTTSFIFPSNLYIFKTFENSYFFNILNKIILDEFYISNFYYIWGNFSIMFILFIFIFFTIFSFKSGLLFNKLVTASLLFAQLYYFNIFDYFFLNTYIFDNDYQLKNYNILLNNSVNKIHPMLLYSSLYFILFNLFLNKLSLPYLHVNVNILKSFYSLPLLVSYLSFTLMLGSWWAFQEGSWGGWWDWDISEVFGLFILVSMLKLLHDDRIHNNRNIYLFSMTHYYTILLIFYFFMQLNFSLISHNFNLNLSSNFVSNFIFLSIILILFVSKLKTYMKNLTFYNFYTINYRISFALSRSALFNFFFLSSTSAIILFSTFYVLSNWLWSNFNVTYSVGLVDFNLFTNLITILFVTIYWNLEFNYFLFIFATLSNSIGLYFILLSTFSFSYSYLVHYSIYLSFVFNSIYKFTESSYWHQLNIGFTEMSYYFYNCIKVDSPMLNSSRLIIDYNLFNTINFNWWYDFSISDFKAFDLCLTMHSTFQKLIQDSDYNIFIVCINSLVENSLLVTTLFTLIGFVIVTLYNKKIIVF